jgi:hypothetical protein
VYLTRAQNILRSAIAFTSVRVGRVSKVCIRILQSGRSSCSFASLEMKCTIRAGWLEAVWSLEHEYTALKSNLLVRPPFTVPRQKFKDELRSHDKEVFLLLDSIKQMAWHVKGLASPCLCRPREVVVCSCLDLWYHICHNILHFRRSWGYGRKLLWLNTF